MTRYFNNAGPQIRAEHYTLDPLGRLNVGELRDLIAKSRYFVLHAPRQTGKTSCLLAFCDLLNAEGRYRALYLNIESAKNLDGERAQQALADALVRRMSSAFPDLDSEKMVARVKALSPSEPFPFLLELLSQADTTRPLVLLIDEADTLTAHATVTFLSQLRAGYTSRPSHFPQTVVLCGLKDFRDYRIIDENGKLLTTGSAFNILAESLKLGNFTKAEVAQLYAQHTAETGQEFAPGVVDLVFDLTWGQPWMVNKLADLACFKMEPGKDHHVTITEEMINAAREEMIRQRTVHLDSLAFRLQEERVQRVIAPMIEGDTTLGGIDAEDIRYCIDLGLIRRDEFKNLIISNPIYREIIPRELTAATQDELGQQTEWYREPDGRMNLPRLLQAFQAFYKSNAEHDKFFPKYSEAGAQLLLQAWLQRIINGGGQIEREYALGSKRVDILVRWPYPRPVQEMVIEMKVIRKKDSPTAVLEEGLLQIEAYMQRVNATEGHLIIFNQQPGADADTKFYEKPAMTPGGRAVTLWGA